MKLIEVENLVKTYDSEGVQTQAMRGLTFTIEKGEFVSIMGPSGSGKSTLMQILGMLDRPSEGVYLFEGKDINSYSDDELSKLRNKKIGFVFQSFNLLPRTTVYENTELPLLYDEDHLEVHNEEKINKALEAVGMSHRTQYLSNQLSGGEKQRVAIARALVNDPEVIFADEPTGNLDSKSGLAVMRILQKLNNEGHTVILVTHETYTAQHAKRILNMKDGMVVSDELVKDRLIADGEGELLK
ncbi:MAG: ABC-type transport system, involved in lipoprotein release, ATPase component [Parcubacteria group bacterium GW2011_GWD2_38_11]|nr:MAG: ABC-type transport system, involved in lipoprotein release, ATPase component [Parcubacteria group bacterium GW2011_GWD2_38_11]